MKQSDIKKLNILQRVKEYYHLTQQEKVDDGKIHYAGRVYDEKEMMMLVESALDFQLTDGRFIKQFEKEIAEYLGVKYSLMVNSGSSANLLAFMTLTSPELKDRQIKKGDEVITLACGFPTTVSPIMQYGAIPVFVDVDIETANIKVEDLEKAVSEKTKAVFIAHTLGNPFNVEEVQKFCKKYNLWLIADCCDSLGSKYKGNSLESQCDISTHSYYCAHHITTGSGGAIHTNNKQLYMIAKSFSSWGRDFKCEECKSDCNRRYEDGYDCRYQYSVFGYNFQPTEMQAAIGLTQLKKLDEFIEKRVFNWRYLRVSLMWGNRRLEDYFQVQIVKDIVNYEVLPFAFLFTLTEKCNFTRNQLVQYLEDNNIETRMLFAGNILKQKCFKNLKENRDYRVIGDLKNTNYIMENSFFIGVYPGLQEKDLNYVVDKIEEFVKNYES